MTVGHLGGEDSKSKHAGEAVVWHIRHHRAGVHADDVTTIRYFGSRAKLNFPLSSSSQDYVEPPVRMVSRADEKENRMAVN